MNENLNRLKRVLSDVLNVPADQITPNSSPDSIKSWDSLSHLKLVLALEGEFNISFSEEQTVEILSFELIRVVLEEHGVQFS